MKKNRISETFETLSRIPRHTSREFQKERKVRDRKDIWRNNGQNLPKFDGKKSAYTRSSRNSK